jgi:hypothetical protein
MFLPEYKDRFLVPSVINCCMNTSELKKFKDQLSMDQTIKFTTFDDNDNVYALLDDMNTTVIEICLCHNPLYDEYIPSDLQGILFTIHVAHTVTIPAWCEPPFTFDFECNALVLEISNNIKLSSNVLKNAHCPLDRLDQLQNVIQDVIHKRARPIAFSLRCQSRNYDVHEMVRLGWDIYDLAHVTYTYKLFQENAPDDFCAICHDDFVSHDTYQLKRSCCNVRYHRACFKKMILHNKFTNVCPACRAPMSHKSLVNRDIKMW